MVPLEGFGPDEGEKAEPIAMGRQTIWGGAGKPPSRDVMQAAARNARQEMMERIRATKSAQGERSNGARPARTPRGEATRTAEGDGSQPAPRGPRRAPARNARQGAPRGQATPQFEARDAGYDAPRAERADNGEQDGQGARRSGQGYNRSRQRPSRDSNSRAAAPQGQGYGEQHAPRPAREPREPRQPREHRQSFGGEGRGRFEDQPPRPDAHLGTQMGRASQPARSSGSAIPDPMRTSVDLMVERPRRNGGGGFRGGNSGGFGGGNGGGNRRRGGGNGGGFNR